MVEKSLETGYVDGSRIVDALSTALNIPPPPTPWSEDSYELQPLTAYWEIWDVWKMLGKGEHKWVHFDFADKVLCVLNLVDLWYEDLSDVYYAVTLVDVEVTAHVPRRVPRGHKRCAAKGCVNTFKVECAPQGGGQPKKYCSVKCRMRAANQREWDKTRVGRYGPKYDKCANGHDRSEENTYVSPKGKRLCRLCARENAKKVRERKRKVQFCPQGHDTFAIGRTKHGKCAECNRIAAREGMRRRAALKRASA